MNAVLIGPSDISKLWRYGTLGEKEVSKYIEEMGAFCSEQFDDIFITPDSGVPLEIAKEFEKHKGKKAIGYYPDKDTVFGWEHIKEFMKSVDARPNNSDWFTLTADLVRRAPVVIVCGLSVGVLIELGYAKYYHKYGKHKIAIFIDSRGGKLPPYFEDDLENVVYFGSVAELKEGIENT